MKAFRTAAMTGDDVLSERGYFWWGNIKIPDDHFAPDDAVAGLLTISERGQIKFELDGVLPNPQERWAAMEQGEFGPDKAIAGLLHLGNRYILATALYRSGGHVSTNGFSSETFIADYCFVSHKHLPLKPRIKSVTFNLTGYEEWQRLGRLEQKRTARSFTIKHHTKPDLVFKSPKGNAKLVRALTIKGEGMFASGGTSLVECAKLRFTPPRYLELASAVNLFGAFQDLLILLTNSEYQMATPEVTLTSLQPAQFHFRRMDGSTTPPTFRDEIMPFPQIETIFGDIVFAWLRARDELGAGAYLYLATRRGLDIYEEHRFLNLMTGLEAYHRARKGDGDTSAFRAKLNRLAKQISAPGDRSWFLKRLKNQGGPSLEGRLINLLGGVPAPLEKAKLDALLSLCAKVRNQIAHKGRSSQADGTGQPMLWLSLHSDIISRLYHARLLLEIGAPRELVKRWLKTNSHLPWYLPRAGLLPE